MPRTNLCTAIRAADTAFTYAIGDRQVSQAGDPITLSDWRWSAPGAQVAAVRAQTPAVWLG